MGNFGSRGGLHHVVPVKPRPTSQIDPSHSPEVTEGTPAAVDSAPEPFIDLRRAPAQHEVLDDQTEESPSTHHS